MFRVRGISFLCLREKIYGQDCTRLRTRFYYFGKRENDSTILRGREYDTEKYVFFSMMVVPGSTMSLDIKCC